MLEFKNEINLDNEILRLKKITRIISLISILLVINLIVWVICFITIESNLLYGLLSIGSLTIVIFHFVFTYRYYKELAFKNNKKEVYRHHKLRRKGEYSKFFDTGADLIDKDDYKELDLDLFGKNSLFQYLSSCKTKYGRLKLRDALTTCKDEDTEYTDAIDYLANNEKTIDIESHLYEFKNDAKTLDYDILYQAFENKIKFKPTYLLPLISFVGTIVYLILIFTLKLNPYYLFIFGFTNYFLSKLFLSNDVYNIDSTKYYNLIDNYYNVALELKNFDSNNKYLLEIKNESENSLTHIKRLKGLLNILATRRNLLFNLLFNILLIFDFWIIFIFNKRA